jgi:hypothetical protein
MKTIFVALGLMDRIAVFHRLLDAEQACLSSTNRIRIAQMTYLHQSKIKLMIKIMRIDVVDLREEGLTRDGSHGFGMNQRVLEMVPEVDQDTKIGMRNGKNVEIGEEMALEKVPEMKNGKVLDIDQEMAQEEIPEMKKEKIRDMALVKALEEAQEVMNGKVQDMAHVEALEEAQEVMSGKVQDMAVEIVLEMKLLNGNSSTTLSMKPDHVIEEYLVKELNSIHQKFSMGHGMTRNIHGATQPLNLARILTLGGTLKKTEIARDGEAIMKVSIEEEKEEVPLIAEITSEEPSVSSEIINWHALLLSLVL